MILDPKLIYIYSSLVLSGVSFSFHVTKLYTVEVFETKYRDTAYGFSNCACRIVSSLSPIICNIVFKIDPYGPCYVMAFSSLIGIVLAMLLPYDTIGKELDESEKDKKGNIGKL